MSFENSIADDFALITDWLKPVTVGGTDVDACLRRAVSTREAAASGGRLLTSDVAFHVDAAEYPTRPAIGTAIVDEDGTWTVLEVQWHTLAKRWRCMSRQLLIDDTEPTNRVTIQSPTYTKGASGAIKPTFSTAASNVLARVQLIESEIDTSYANRTTTTAAKVYFAAPQSLGPGYRIIRSDGLTLKVISWNGFDSLDQFFTASCEVSKWPLA